MQLYTLGALVCALSVLTGCNGQTTPGTTPGGQTTQPRLKVSEVKFDSLWLKGCVEAEARLKKLEYADELTSLTCRGYPKAFDSYITNTSGAQMLVDSTSGLEQLTGLSALDLSDNYINHIDLSKLKKLTNLKLDGNLLQRLDLSNYTALKSLSLSQNPLLTLKLPRNGQLESLKLSFDPNSSDFFGYSRLKSYLDTNPTALKNARFFDDKTGELLSSESFQRISNVDFSQQSQLKSLTATNMGLYEQTSGLESFPTPNSLENLDLQFNSFTGINVSNLTNLKVLNLNSNTVITLDIKSNPHLEDLSIARNRFSSIKALPNNKLRSLNILATFVVESDLENVFNTKSLTSVSMHSGELLPTVLAPNLTSLTLTNTGAFDTNRLNSALKLKYLTLDSGSIDGLNIFNLAELERANIKLSEQKTPVSVSCYGDKTSLDITLSNMTPSENNLEVFTSKGCELKKVGIYTYAAANKIDLSGTQSEDLVISSKDTSYTNVKLPSHATSLAFDGIIDMQKFSFYDFYLLQSMAISRTFLPNFSLKGGSNLKEFGMHSVQLDQFQIDATTPFLTKVTLEALDLKTLDIASIAQNLTSLSLLGCTIENFRSNTFNSGISLEVIRTKLEGESLATFKQVSGRDLDSAGNLIALQK